MILAAPVLCDEQHKAEHSEVPEAKQERDDPRHTRVEGAAGGGETFALATPPMTPGAVRGSRARPDDRAGDGER